MLNELLNNVIERMADDLNSDQLRKLKEALSVVFHDVEIKSCSYELQTTPKEDDLMKVKMFLTSKSISGRQPSTLKQYKNEIDALLGTINKPIKDITTNDFRYYFGLLKARGCSMRTIQTRKRYFNSFWTFMLNEGYVSSNPISRIEAIKVDKRVRKAFSAEDLESIRLACGTLRDRAIVEFLYATGVRVSELCGLKVGDIDLYKKEFTVVGKGNKERKCFINDISCYHLYRYLVERVQKRKITFDALKNESLFASTKSKGHSMTPEGIQKLLKRISTKSGIQNVHPHRFRRTFASDLLSRGMKLQDLRILMGHEKIDTTLIYCNINQSDVEMSYRIHTN